MSDKKILISLERAIAALPKGNDVHTFRSGRMTLLGADWDKSDLIEAMTKSDHIEIGGDACKSMNHGIVFFDEHGPVFVEGAKDTDWNALEAAATKQ